VRRGWLRRPLAEAGRLDLALYRAVAKTRTPALSAVFARLSRAADYSRLSIAFALGLALAGGLEGRRGAARGMASVAVTAAIVNLAFKPAMRRRRPDRTRLVAAARGRVRMPASHSFPSGHSAAAFAFATGASREVSWAGPPLYALAGLVGYSRIHTGVHYPLDVVAGALFGMVAAELTSSYIDRVVRREPGEVPDRYQSHGVSMPTSDSCSRYRANSSSSSGGIE
jgi:membrane-associated phospholipid phosphatase